MPDETLSHTLRGIFAALPTPLTEDREVDIPGLVRLVRYNLSGGIHGLWLLGSSGEFTAFSSHERRLIIEVTVQEVQRAVPILVGIGDNDIRKVVRNAEEALSLGADACFVLLPFYFAVDPKEAIRYFKQVAEAVPLPLILYDNPLPTKVKLDPTAFLELSDTPNIVAIKDSSCDFIRTQRLVMSLRHRTSWRLLQGDERLIGWSLLCGADGGVAALASLAPALFVDLYKAAEERKLDEMLVLQRRVLTLSQLFELKGEATDGAFFSGLKAALHVLGICGRTVSAPFSPMPDEKIPEVENLLHQCQISSGGGVKDGGNAKAGDDSITAAGLRSILS